MSVGLAKLVFHEKICSVIEILSFLIKPMINYTSHYHHIRHDNITGTFSKWLKSL